ncbi:MAG: hypothetical protein DF168_01696 [Candidatus Moanabacter tarae]|uniref:Uncharacterized protein n=1 Tax=Candidatus Moanibacter tarae TaxID=2200854 RepID=A0A2Z4AR79_9BACT|nr:MAG: hypothetical protein DF168_01696 [Candidatus Moanabacter tarae]
MNKGCLEETQIRCDRGLKRKNGAVVGEVIAVRCCMTFGGSFRIGIRDYPFGSVIITRSEGHFQISTT